MPVLTAPPDVENPVLSEGHVYKIIKSDGDYQLGHIFTYHCGVGGGGKDIIYLTSCSWDTYKVLYIYNIQFKLVTLQEV